MAAGRAALGSQAGGGVVLRGVQAGGGGWMRSSCLTYTAQRPWVLGGEHGGNLITPLLHGGAALLGEHRTQGGGDHLVPVRNLERTFPRQKRFLFPSKDTCRSSLSTANCIILSLIRISPSLSRSRQLLLFTCRVSIFAGLLLLPITIYSNHLALRSISARPDATPSSLVLNPNDSSQPRPLGSNTTLDTYKEAARRIWSSNEDTGLRLRHLVTLLYLQYDKSELINPWYYDWFAFLLSKTGLPKLRDLSSAIEPTDIARANQAFCSQLSILLMSILDDLGVNYQALRINIDNGENGHFVTLAFASSRVFLLDPHRNPPFDISGQSTLRLLSSGDTLSTFNKIYKPTGLHVESVNIQLGDWNSFPASNSRAIRVITKNVSLYAWIGLIAVGSLGLLLMKKSRKSIILDQDVS